MYVAINSLPVKVRAARADSSTKVSASKEAQAEEQEARRVEEAEAALRAAPKTQ